MLLQMPLHDFQIPSACLSLVVLCPSTSTLQADTAVGFLWYSSTEFSLVYLHRKPALLVCPKLFWQSLEERHKILGLPNGGVCAGSFASASEWCSCCEF